MVRVGDVVVVDVRYSQVTAEYEICDTMGMDGDGWDMDMVVQKGKGRGMRRGY